MNPDSQKADLDSDAWAAFQECSCALEKEQLAVELRPRLRDKETAFSGDYDFLMNPSQFEKIVQLFFCICVKHAVSFHVQQRSVFKRQIVLLGSIERKIIFEFWPHAELTTDTHRKGWSFLPYQYYAEACQAGFKDETEAMLFVCHLYFKRKDLSSPQNHWRLVEFVERMDRVVEKGGPQTIFAEKARELLSDIIQRRLALDEANQKALNLLAERDIQIAGCGFAKRSRMLAKAAGFFRGWGAQIVPCVGPDGSGKTYFIEEVMRLTKKHSMKSSSCRFKKMFRKRKLYSYINKIYRTQKGLSKNTADERLAHLIFWFALPAYMGEIIKSLRKNALFMDRFFLEFMVRGYRESKTIDISEIRGYSVLCRLIPTPRKLIVLTADDDLISSRKMEMSTDAIQDLYRRYISYSISRKVSSVLFLNTHRSGPKLAECCLHSFGMLQGTDK